MYKIQVKNYKITWIKFKKNVLFICQQHEFLYSWEWYLSRKVCVDKIVGWIFPFLYQISGFLKERIVSEKFHESSSINLRK